MVDGSGPLDAYKAVIVPDDVELSPAMAKKLAAYLKKGGRLVLSGASGLDPERQKFLLPVPARAEGMSPSQPDYVLPAPAFRGEGLSTPMVMYAAPVRLKADKKPGVQSLGVCHDSYFNRAWNHFSSHQHTPFRPQASGYDCGVMGGNVLYFAHPVFALYMGYGAVALKRYVVSALRAFLGDALTLESNLPSTARAHVMEQKKEKRYVCHLLYATPVARGGEMQLSGGTVATRRSIEVIEELLPLHDVEVALKLPRPVKRVTLEPQGAELPFATQGGRVRFRLDQFTCHQMVALHW